MYNYLNKDDLNKSLFVVWKNNRQHIKNYIRNMEWYFILFLKNNTFYVTEELLYSRSQYCNNTFGQILLMFFSVANQYCNKTLFFSPKKNNK